MEPIVPNEHGPSQVDALKYVDVRAFSPAMLLVGCLLGASNSGPQGSVAVGRTRERKTMYGLR